MKSYFRSIRFQIWLVLVSFTLIIMMILYVGQTALTPVFYRFMKTQEAVNSASRIKTSLTQNGDVDAEDAIANISSLAKELAVTQQMDILINFPRSNLNITQNKSGSPTTISNRVLNQEIKEQLSSTPNNMLLIPVEEDGTEAMLFATHYAENGMEAYIFVYSYMEPIGTTISITQRMLLISANVILLIACIIAIALSSHISNPLIKIAKNADQLITGNFYMPVRKHEYEEIATLTENLNEASKEISKTEMLQKDLVANVSHDLRTPLTMIKAYAEMIRDLSGDNPEKREKHLEVIINETDRLTLLVSDMLNLSKLQSGVAEMKNSVFNFSEHLEDLIGRFNLLDDTIDYRIELKTDEDIYMNADIQRIEQVVYNLVNNAINYIGEDKLVFVRLCRINSKTARFEVSDHGVGIPPEQIPYIWERYYKVDRSKNHKRAVKGTGLGLSIVKGILETHGFPYGVNSIVNQGSTFWFEFPIADAIIEGEISYETDS